MNIARFAFLFSFCWFCFSPTSPTNCSVLAQGAPSKDEQTAANQAINENVIKSHIKFLADDLLEGRAPGSRGDELGRKYIAAKFESLGLKPAAGKGNWFQPVPLLGLKTTPPKTITFNNKEKSLTLKRSIDFVAVSGKPKPTVGFEDAELVFVGYGMVAPEYDWDDYKGVDLKGKVLLMMNNDPAGDPELFAGNKRLYYGRWDYKYMMAAKQGAAGAIIIHTTESAGYPYQVVQTSWAGEEFELADQKGPRTEMKGWVTEDAARKITQLSGLDLDELRKSAEKRSFRPVSLGSTLSMKMTCKFRKQQTANVLGVLEGSDPELKKEHVIFMAHHDHIGMAETRDETGDNIYNGAVDNASGCASMLAICDAVTRLKVKPKRSILFASVGAEEQGLLGSLYLAQNPPFPVGYMAAVVNMDGINIIGPTHDINVIGLGKSNMDEFIEAVAKFQNRGVTPDQFPDRGYYYRSDQFSLAKVGVPGVYLHSGIRVIGKPIEYGKGKINDWTQTHYHQPSDEFSEDWDLRGAVMDTKLLFHVGIQAANKRAMPAWKAGDEFENARKSALKARN